MPASILKLPQVTQRTSLSRSHLYALISVGAFPKQVRLGSRSVGWLESEVDSFIAARVAERDAANDAPASAADSGDWKAKLRARKGAQA